MVQDALFPVEAQVPSGHRCPCGCGERIARNKLACKVGWYRLPAELRDLVNSAWRAISEARGDEAKATARARHMLAVGRAVDWYRDHPRS